jgi:flagellar hook-associated protein 3 FlgL
MRISTAQLFYTGLRSIQDAQSSAQRTQAEIAAGKRVLTPADDPSGSALALRIEQETARARQYQANIDVADRDLKQEESQLAAVENVLFRLRELVVSAGNGAHTATERGAIADELDERAEELLGIFNSQQANGEFLFAGFEGLTRPFEKRPGGVVEYMGDTGQRFLQVSTGVDLEVRDNGKGLFVDIPSANNTFRTLRGAANTGTGDLNVGRIVDQAAWDAVFPDDIVISFDEPLGPDSFSIYQRDDATGVLTLLDSQAFEVGEPVVAAGLEVRIVGSPASGDEFTLEAANRQSLITTIQRISMVLGSSADTPEGATERSNAIAEALGNLDLAETQVFGGRSRLGSRFNVLDTIREEQAQLELINQQLTSQIVDLDYNEAISRLSYQTFALEAAQKSLAKISSLSLFDYL